MLIDGKVFIVTGGGSGLGAGVARLLHGKGARVVLADINEDAGRAMAEALGSNALFVKTDVTSETDGAAAVTAAVDTFGHINGLVNCAGMRRAKRYLGATALIGSTALRVRSASI